MIKYDYLMPNVTFVFFQMRRSISNMDSFYIPYLTTEETRYNELLLVVDFTMVSNGKRY